MVRLRLCLAMFPKVEFDYVLNEMVVFKIALTMFSSAGFGFVLNDCG